MRFDQRKEIKEKKLEEGQVSLSLWKIYTLIHMVRSCHLVAILSESVIYEEEGYKAIPIKEAKETMHASLVYVKGMYQHNAVKEFSNGCRKGKSESAEETINYLERFIHFDTQRVSSPSRA